VKAKRILWKTQSKSKKLGANSSSGMARVHGHVATGASPVQAKAEAERANHEP
jgi:hypothetical protein